MAKKMPTEEEMIEAIKKNPKVREVWGALRDHIPEAISEFEEKLKRAKAENR
ncbi:MAG: hypothetical protein ACE5KE_11885 [Methanosarcinales archaeon]